MFARDWEWPIEEVPGGECIGVCGACETDASELSGLIWGPIPGVCKLDQGPVPEL